MTDLSDLVIPATEDELRETMLASAEAQSLPVTSWHDGAVWKVLFALFPELLGDAFFAIAQIANGAVLGLARRSWLDLIATSEYQDARKRAGFTIGACVLENTTVSPIVVTAGNVVVGDDLGHQYRLATGGTVPPGDSLAVTLAAVAVGAAYNVPNDTITTMVTTVAGLTVNNPADPSTGTWITTLGRDVESDTELTARLPLKWATLSPGSPPSAYESWALAVDGVTRAKCDDANPDGPNTTRLYIDSSALVSTVQAIVAAKVPSGTRCTVMAATTETVTVAGVVTVQRAYRAAAEVAVADSLAAYEIATIIGGIVRQAEIIERTMSPEGVVDFEVASSWAGTPNIQLGATAIPSIALSLTWVEV